MGLLKLLAKPLSGYPGGYKKMRRGSQPVDAAPPFRRPDNYGDRRSRIPPTGYREYWYPALPAKDVKGDKPETLRMLGRDLVFFRDTAGEVQALLDWCPHRAVYLSMGRCHYPGFVTCPYHGATFDGAGNCVAFLTEGPDSRMVGAPGDASPQVSHYYPQGPGLCLDGRRRAGSPGGGYSPGNVRGT